MLGFICCVEMSFVIFAVLSALSLALPVFSASLLIQGGTVVNHDKYFKADIWVRGETIIAVGPDLQVPEDAEILDASGMYVMPGGIDPHTHLDMPFMGSTSVDDFFSGQAAALAGGTTMHIDFALPVNHDIWAGWEAWQEKAKGSCMDYSFHMAVTSWTDKVSEDMGRLAKQGINSFKFFMAYKNMLQISDELLLSALARCKELGALPMVHAENGDAVAWGQDHVFNVLKETGPAGHALSRPPVVEAEATGRAIRLAELVGVPLYIVHVMSKEAMEEIAAAKQRGARVIGEPVASGLALSEEVMWHHNFTQAAQYVMSPPIKGKEHREALKKALAGGILSHVATDHASFNSTQKALGADDFRKIPNGVHGLEERMHVVWEEMVSSGLMSPSDYVRATSTGAAQAFNLYPRKGHIAVGSDADIILLDPTKVHTLGAARHHHNNDMNIYEGMVIHGKIEVTIRRGDIVWKDGKLMVQPGTGRFLPLPLFGPLFEGLEQRQASEQAKYEAYRLLFRKSQAKASPLDVNTQADAESGSMQCASKDEL